MNERIKEIAIKSGFHFYDMHDVNGEDLGETIESDDWESAQRFAELIIKECIVIADEFEFEVNRSGLVDSIKHHFEIE